MKETTAIVIDVNGESIECKVIYDPDIGLTAEDDDGYKLICVNLAVTKEYQAYSDSNKRVHELSYEHYVDCIEKGLPLAQEDNIAYYTNTLGIRFELFGGMANCAFTG